MQGGGARAPCPPLWCPARPQVDATAKENEDAKGKFKISGFPTIKVRAARAGVVLVCVCAVLCVNALKRGLGTLVGHQPRRRPAHCAAAPLPSSLFPCPCLSQIFKGDFAAPSAYDGPRDEAGIVRYLKKQVGRCVCVCEGCSRACSSAAMCVCVRGRGWNRDAKSAGVRRRQPLV